MKGPGIAVLLGLTMFGTSSIPGAWAADWFEAEFCTYGECSIKKKCPKASTSPAQIYENWRGAAEIVDKTDSRVDVIGHARDEPLWIFFRDAESCQRYVDERLRVNKQEREKEQEMLGKYR